MATSFAFDNTFAAQMDGFFLPAEAAAFPSPELVVLNEPLAMTLGLEVQPLRDDAAAIFSGQSVPENADPIAQFYAGHQFGGFSPQLGDGRALLLGELVDAEGRRFDLQLKGSGPTEFSRGGDGKASLGPMLREHVISEAMHALGVPTTRSLAVVTTGEPVFRERPLPGAVLARVAASHLRVGTFEYFASRQDITSTRRLADYTIERHYPHLAGTPNPYVGLLNAVVDAQAELIAQWMMVGFIHGVMNTDNVALSGETIDYGPCAFMDRFDPRTVYSSIDHRGRYAYGNQPGIGQWNIARFAETLLPLLDDDKDVAMEHARKSLQAFALRYQTAWTKGMRAKLGIVEAEDEDESLATALTTLLEGARLDYTKAMRGLSSVARGSDDMFADVEGFDAWAARWLARIDREPGGRGGAAERMDTINPIYIPRNHLVEEALGAAVDGDLDPMHRLLEAVTDPFTRRDGLDRYAEPAPEAFDDGYKTFCGT
ncbi:MAG: protein adenylyltransferase SelO [Nannocystaceae bacterium]|nr:YdiU family protein [bacterium]